MEAEILSLATSIPQHTFSQEEIGEKMIAFLEFEPEKSGQIRHLYRNSAIEQRHSVIPDFKLDRDEWHFWGYDYPKNTPGTSKRNEIYKKEAPKLAHEAATKAIKEWGGSPSEITHVISVSCTGLMAPGLEFELLRSLNLNWSVNRLGINFMGCFGAFKGMAVARAFAKENPKHRILLVCTELCSLHLQADKTADNILGNSLFSDGCAAAIIGTHPGSPETPLWSILKTYSLGLDNTLNKMSWDVSENGFLMKLSPQVPVFLGRHVSPFISSLLNENEVDPTEYDWAIHPGGKSIIQAIEKGMDLDQAQTQVSWDILRDYGNMSSATFLFVLEKMKNTPSVNKKTIGLGFGPGLSFEGILLENKDV